MDGVLLVSVVVVRGLLQRVCDVVESGAALVENADDPVLQVGVDLVQTGEVPQPAELERTER
jgi:hypothetical protein